MGSANEQQGSLPPMAGAEFADHERAVSGACPILVVPFDNAGNVDIASFEREVAFACDAGAQGMTLFGLASEYYKLDDDERFALVDALFRAVAPYPGVAPIVSVTDHSLEVATRRVRAYVSAGATIINVLPPFFLQPPKQKILDYLEAVCAAVPDTEIMIQYAPEFTGTMLAPEEIAGMAIRHQNLRYAKVEVQPPSQYIRDLLVSSSGRVQSLIGYQGLFAPEALAHGAIGIQPGPALTDCYVRLWDSLRASPPNHAPYRSLLPYISYWMQNLELAIRVEKEILYRRGIIATSRCRQPSYELGEFDHGMIDAALREFDIK